MKTKQLNRTNNNFLNDGIGLFLYEV
jgi:hypothetical protein